jgi:hypothetical protein
VTTRTHFDLGFLDQVPTKLTIAGCLSPIQLLDYLHAFPDSLTSRILFAIPRSPELLNYTAKKKAAEHQEETVECIAQWLIDIVKSCSGRKLRFDSKAEELFTSYFDETQDKLRHLYQKDPFSFSKCFMTKHSSQGFADIYSKSKSLVARLAAAVELLNSAVDGLVATVVTGASVTTAIRIVHYCIETVLTFKQTSKTEPNSTDSKRAKHDKQKADQGDSKDTQTEGAQ